MSLVELLSSMPALWLTVVGLLSLLIGSFLTMIVLPVVDSTLDSLSSVLGKWMKNVLPASKPK